MSSESVTLEQRMATISRKLEIRIHPGFIYSSLKGSVHIRGKDGYHHTIVKPRILHEIYVMESLLTAIQVITDGDTTNPKWNEYCENFNNYIYANDTDATPLQDRLILLGVHDALLFTLPDCIATLFVICLASKLISDPHLIRTQHGFMALYDYSVKGGEKPVKVITQAEIQAVRDAKCKALGIEPIGFKKLTANKLYIWCLINMGIVIPFSSLISSPLIQNMVIIGGLLPILIGGVHLHLTETKQHKQQLNKYLKQHETGEK